MVFILFIGSLGFGLTKASAQTPTSSPRQSFIERLAQKLGIGEEKVQQAFDDIMEERQSQVETRFEMMLNQAVKDGKLTEAQKKSILERRTQMKEQAKGWANLTPQSRRDGMKNQREDLKSWATQNGIDIKYLFGGMRGHHGMMMGKWGWK